MYWSIDTCRYALRASRYRHGVFMLYQYPGTDKLYLVSICLRYRQALAFASAGGTDRDLAGPQFAPKLSTNNIIES
jgi:hypothetical protein